MKKTILLFLLLSFNFIYTQNYPEKTKYIKTVHATTYDKKDTLDHRKSITFFDSDWKVLTNTNTLSSALDKGSKTVKILDSPRKKVSAIITSKKDTLDYLVNLYDEKGNKTNNYQIRNGDTLVDQKRIFDQKNNYLKLFNKKNGRYYLSLKNRYNSQNQLVLTSWFNKYSQKIKIYKYKYLNKGKRRLTYKSNKKGTFNLIKESMKLNLNKEKIKYYIDSKGINYGITLRKKKGYYSIEEKDDKKRLKSLEIFDSKHNLKTSVYISYKKI